MSPLWRLLLQTGLLGLLLLHSSLQLVTGGEPSFATAGERSKLTARVPEPRPRGNPRFDVSLVSQTSSDRLWMVESICLRWRGPVVMAVHTRVQPDGLDASSPDSAAPSSCKELTIRRHHGVSVRDYPVNWLRNQALALVTTSHFLVVDIDFWPSTGLYDALLQRQAFLAQAKTALVVPAFERHGSGCPTLAKCQALSVRDPSFMPSTFEDLLACVDRDACAVFQGAINIGGHSTTQTKEWYRYSAQQAVDTVPIACFKSTRYEPYLVIRREQGLPKYDERFTGYGKNKIQYVQHLRYAGYRFAILPREFLVHYPHPKSSAKMDWIRNHTLHRDTDNLYRKFLYSLASKYGSRSMQVPLCKLRESAVEKEYKLQPRKELQQQQQDEVDQRRHLAYHRQQQIEQRRKQQQRQQTQPPRQEQVQWQRQSGAGTTAIAPAAPPLSHAGPTLSTSPESAPFWSKVHRTSLELHRARRTNATAAALLQGVQTDGAAAGATDAAPSALG